ncbi:ectoine hydroxylase [Tamaricihabitans halophyticus]|uniref:Ectoine hydroxylase n=1 Tax=Tamaricihabitans halophyticus TaxID=1262583 RepID=A0A4V2SV31_9PSEU|nr:ectoine hydroxylase [Tamaricihabitans halophyticus]TCP56626.1 ectoine hydroxylase [Tamaricihabitans halophyticus]
MTLATRTEDRYPTRIPAYAANRPIERTDPTVWSTEADGPIDAASLAGYEAKGFSIVEGLLSPAEVQAYWQELVRLCKDPELKRDDRVIAEKSANEVRSIFEVHKLSGLIAELARDPRVLDRARQLLGSEVYLHQTRVNYMPGYQGKGFYWHSDFETWHAEDGMPAPRAVSISIALTDNYPFNGGLMVMPGSHRMFLPCAGETPDEHYRASLREQEFGIPKQDQITMLAVDHGIEQFTGPAGSALLFDSNLMHGSGNNITPFPRSNIFLVFNSVANTLVEPFSAGKPRPEYIASREFTALTR